MKLDHVAVAVRDLASAVHLWGDMLGGTYKQGLANFHGFSSVQLQYDNGSRVELISPSPEPDTFVRRFLEKRGEGMHHMTFIVSDLRTEVHRFKQAGFRIADEDYSDGHWMEAFISPPMAHGVLIQLAQSDLTQEEQDAYWDNPLEGVLAAADAAYREGS